MSWKSQGAHTVFVSQTLLPSFPIRDIDSRNIIQNKYMRQNTTWDCDLAEVSLTAHNPKHAAEKELRDLNSEGSVCLCKGVCALCSTRTDGPTSLNRVTGWNTNLAKLATPYPSPYSTWMHVCRDGGMCATGGDVLTVGVVVLARASIHSQPWQLANAQSLVHCAKVTCLSHLYLSPTLPLSTQRTRYCVHWCGTLELDTNPALQNCPMLVWFLGIGKGWRVVDLSAACGRFHCRMWNKNLPHRTWLFFLL